MNSLNSVVVKVKFININIVVVYLNVGVTCVVQYVARVTLLLFLNYVVVHVVVTSC